MTLPRFIQANASMAGLTTFGIGGPARWLARPTTVEELVEALELTREWNVPVCVVGGGSNLLVADSGIEAMVIKLAPGGDFSELSREADDPLAWRVGAAVGLPALLGAAIREGAAGLEGMAGVPGSVGGAVAMNAGGAELGIGRLVREAEVFDLSGARHQVTPPELSFSYRNSSLRGMVATRFRFRFERLEDPETLRERMREYRERKKAGQPLAIPSAGCVFKNPLGDSAGSLLDKAGCKGMEEGGAVVSALHANFIVNQGHATARDVATLALRMREAVVAAFGIRLEPEVALWGEEPVFSSLCK